MSNTPSNEDIDLLARAYLGDCGPQANRIYSFVTAVLAKWGTPQPVVREPLGNKELQAISLEYSDSEDECTGFRDGWRFAEKHYGITQNGGSNADA